MHRFVSAIHLSFYGVIFSVKEDSFVLFSQGTENQKQQQSINWPATVWLGGLNNCSNIGEDFVILQPSGNFINDFPSKKQTLLVTFFCVLLHCLCCYISDD